MKYEMCVFFIIFQLFFFLKNAGYKMVVTQANMFALGLNITEVHCPMFAGTINSIYKRLTQAEASLVLDPT